MRNPELNVAKNIECFTAFNDDCEDRHGHGTHVAGIIGGRKTGVTPNAKLLSVKVLDDYESGSMSGVIAGIEHCILVGCDVINMSLGGPAPDMATTCNNDPFQEAVCRADAKGIVIIVAAANEARLAKHSVPARFPQAITVSAISNYDGNQGGQATAPPNGRGPDDTLASFSNFGFAVNIAAPGTMIWSTIPGGGYSIMSGTSMAAPHVTGAAVITIIKIGKQQNTEVVRDYLVARGDNSYSDVNDGFHEPMLNVYNLDSTASFPSPAHPPPSNLIFERTGESGLRGSQSHFVVEIDVPWPLLIVQILGEAGSAGDADLYVRFDSQPTEDDYDCAPYIDGSDEVCAMSDVNPGRCHVMLVGYRGYTRVTLQVIGSHE